MKSKETRSSGDGMQRDAGQTAGGVGARHRQLAPRGQGGWYLDICTHLESPIRKKSARDPRIHGLRSMGLSWKLIRLAEAIGYDAFMSFWAEASVLFAGEQSSLCIKMPLISSYERVQRNQMIRRMLADGMSPREVRTALAVAGINISERHICRQRPRDD